MPRAVVMCLACVMLCKDTYKDTYKDTHDTYKDTYIRMVAYATRGRHVPGMCDEVLN